MFYLSLPEKLLLGHEVFGSHLWADGSSRLSFDEGLAGLSTGYLHRPELVLLVGLAEDRDGLSLCLHPGAHSLALDLS